MVTLPLVGTYIHRINVRRSHVLSLFVDPCNLYICIYFFFYYIYSLSIIHVNRNVVSTFIPFRWNIFLRLERIVIVVIVRPPHGRCRRCRGHNLHFTSFTLFFITTWFIKLEGRFLCFFSLSSSPPLSLSFYSLSLLSAFMFFFSSFFIFYSCLINIKKWFFFANTMLLF